MRRRRMVSGAAACFAAVLLRPLGAAAAEVGEREAASGIRAALERAAGAAVTVLGRSGGFSENPQVRIPLPGFLSGAARLLKLAGQQHRLDDLELTMNQAAEAAVPQARTLLVSAVRSMSLEDARQIVTGADDSATRFFASKTRDALYPKFLPIVARATQRVALADKYDAIAGQAASLGLLRPENASLQQYVTERALDGLYRMIGEEERKIRRDPVATGSAILQKVFGFGR